MSDQQQPKSVEDGLGRAEDPANVSARLSQIISHHGQCRAATCDQRWLLQHFAVFAFGLLLDASGAETV